VHHARSYTSRIPTLTSIFICCDQVLKPFMLNQSHAESQSRGSHLFSLTVECVGTWWKMNCQGKKFHSEFKNPRIRVEVRAGSWLVEGSVLRILSRYLGGRISYILDSVTSCHRSSLSLTPVLLLLPNIPGQALWCSVSLRGVVTDSLLHFFELSSCWEQSLNPQALKL